MRSWPLEIKYEIEKDFTTYAKTYFLFILIKLKQSLQKTLV